jgi:predicted ATPase
LVPPAPVRAVITGGPGAGKSTLLEALAERGLTVYPEVARSILQKPGGMAMRADRPADFALAMLEAEQEVWSHSRTGFAVFDRGFPDIAGFLNLEGLPIPPALDEICKSLRYSGPIFHAAVWRAIYTPDEERIQSWQQAVESDEAVSSAWRHYGYRLVTLPQSSVAERAAFVMEHLQPMLACNA